MIRVERSGDFRPMAQREERHAMHDSPDAGLSIRARDGSDGYTKSVLSPARNRRAGMQTLGRHCVRSTRD